MRIGVKLTIAFFLVALTSISVVGIISYRQGKKSLEAESFNRLTAVREMKASQIEDYFKLIHDQLLTFSEDPFVVYSFKQFRKGFFNAEKELGVTDDTMQAMHQQLEAYFNNEYLKRLNPNLEKKILAEEDMSTEKPARILQYLYIANNHFPVGNKHKLDEAEGKCSYNEAHKKYHPVFRDFLERFGYYDIFLVDDSSGHIVYSVFKEVDFASSLLQGPFRETNLANAFEATRNSTNPDFIKLVDFKQYRPSYNAPASFIATPIYDGKKKIATLIFQMPVKRIDDIMTSNNQWAKVGLGASGETYLVGDDYTLRNQSRFLIEDSKNYFKMIKDIGTSPATIKQIKNYNSSIGLQEVKTKGTKAALAGKTDTEIFPDYRGVPVLSSYKPLNIEGMHWVIMSEIDEEEAFSHVTQLRKIIIWVFAGMIILILIGSYFMSHALTIPLKKLTGHARQLAKGNLDVEIDVVRKDEIGVLSVSFRKMQHSVKRLIEDLREINHNLEDKVKERTHEIHLQKEMVEEKNKEIVDSINYAKRLQSAIIPPENKVLEIFPDSFVLFKPKDIVSGDFYWMETLAVDRGRLASISDAENKKATKPVIAKADGLVVLAVADCTGHGVPGAMVSVVGANSLNRCVKEFGLKTPGTILDKLRELIISTFELANHEVKDGMDISLFVIDLNTGHLQWSGANNPLWILRKGGTEIEEIKADKQPIGKFDHGKPFSNHEIKVQKGDCVYLFSDGYADQFGGDKGKKLKASTMRDLFVSMHDKSMQEQKKVMDDSFEMWRGSLEQIDDVCVIGVRF